MDCSAMKHTNRTITLRMTAIKNTSFHGSQIITTNPMAMATPMVYKAMVLKMVSITILQKMYHQEKKFPSTRMEQQITIRTFIIINKLQNLIYLIKKYLLMVGIITTKPKKTTKRRIQRMKSSKLIQNIMTS